MAPPTSRLALAALAGALALTGPAFAQFEEGAEILGREPTGPVGPAPRTPDGHPDLTGYWKGLREPGRPGGNIGKDLPGFKLPLTPAGEAALKRNLTQT